MKFQVPALAFPPPGVFLLCPAALLLALAGCMSLPAASTASAPAPDGIDGLRSQFQTPPDDARVMMRWWWFGPAVTKDELARELRVMKASGIGGVEIQPVYPLALDDAATGTHTTPYLSDGFIDALRFAQTEARTLGLRFDLTVGSGWPFGGATVPIAQAAGQLRVERVKLADGDTLVRTPSLEAGEALLAVFLVHADGTAVTPGSAHEVRESGAGQVTLPPDRADANEIMFFISSHTGQQVKRAAVGAEGYVLNHYDRAAVEAYLTQVGDRLLQAFGDQPPYAVFCDSLECYNSDWTPGLLDEFARRRGYDLKPWLPALVADYGPRTAEIRNDWGRTLTELLEENFVQPVQAWAARHRTKFRFQGYGIPPATVSTSRLADLPEGEGSQWKVLRASRWAASTSHLYGRPVTSSETWTWLHSPAFRATPLDLKAEAHLHFLQGINQLIGHGWPYSPPTAAYPGARFYAAAALNDQNPWWTVMPDLMRYLQRTSYALRQGRPANDIAFYLPNSDARARFHNREANLIDTLRERIGDETVARTLEAGYNLDFFDDDALRNVGTVEPGVLTLGGNPYRVVLLPNVERIPPATLQKLAAFADGGGILIATRRLPVGAPGLQATEPEQAAVQATVHRLFTAPGAPGHFWAKLPDDFAPALNALLPPDVGFSAGRSVLGFVHRRLADAELYFVANTGAERVSTEAVFRTTAPRAEWWDAAAGTATAADLKANAAGQSTLALTLEPYEARIIVFRRDTNSTSAPPATPRAAAVSLLELSTGWQLQFADQPAIKLEQLRSWTDDASTRYFSGQAAYEKEFTMPATALTPGTRIVLDFGEARAIPERTLTNGMQTWLEAPVRDAAVVYVNGVRAGSVWCPPYTLDVSDLLRPGINRLRIVVANTAINALAGRNAPNYKLLNLRYGERFQPQDMDHLQPLPSGLTGPIRLLALPARRD